MDVTNMGQDVEPWELLNITLLMGGKIRTITPENSVALSGKLKIPRTCKLWPVGPSGLYLFLCSLQAKNGFYIFNWLKQTRNTIFCSMWKLFKIHVSVFTNEILKHSRARSHRDCLWHFRNTISELNSCNRDYRAFRASNSYYLVLPRKSLPPSVLLNALCL